MPTMLHVMTLLPLLFLALLPCIHGAALTTVLAPQERSCFYAWVDKAGEKVGFYFAVQSGGSFDIDYHIASPSDKVVLEGQKERQLDVVFTGNEVGEYAFCFENDMSNFNEKMIDFDITVESEPRLDAPLSGAALLTEHSAPLEDSIQKLDGQLTQVQRTQRYFRVWENRGFSTVRSTQSKLLWYSIIESLVVIGLSLGQVHLVRRMFEKGSTRRYRV
ncbi:hypothetical protein FA09DRAFT_330137 [Tilletiopsis washingtonensis]|uniref:GOLD domain-containing protein n=1 Tax=Tilletiopsis washingtonensis TaxID=58919 RepID=A0A316Z8Q2_9BASI|nr:hypothetical protein FA09DRAFT_330137 [Tilletiopsis washingtonensis]PWN97979.1 hypothetical protein FA09DRAFT_330137 [Tilletiopsis washingtonensis]